MNPEVQQYFDLIKTYLSEKYGFEDTRYSVTESGFRLDLRLTPEQTEKLEAQRDDLALYAKKAAWFAADQLRTPVEQVAHVGFQFADGVLTLYGAPPVLSAFVLQIFDAEPC